MTSSYDATIIGAGIVGLATAIKLGQAFPEWRIAIVEKEHQPGLHQTGHNSGVIHSGIYYRPGSLKAHLCVSGAGQLVRFCRNHGILHEICGKVVIATKAEEVPILHELYRRGVENGVPGLKIMEPPEVGMLEPHTRCFLGLHVPTTGIVDFGEVVRAYAALFQDRGGTLHVGYRLVAVNREDRGLRVETTQGSFFSKFLINCGGLYSDHVARMAGLDPPCQIIPFRGEYYRIRPERSHLVGNLIYPVPDPRFPFLGVHFTRMIDGKVEAGPNAVLALVREGYSRTTVALAELTEILRYRGFWQMASRYWRAGWGEMVRSHSKRRFAEALQELLPEICEGDLLPGGAGVRAQAVGKDGRLVDDFVILQSEHMVHVLNAPSPAATSSLAIADHIVGILRTRVL